ncbi:5'-methylthioadenosine/adenosylhomocysteine nucleosidase [Fusobacterium necrophorum]|uniref:adenosylhomocysteine nucleosidase n=1 Tax=Fusobacterium necrophorum TaxID=859 RepID=A0A4Q2KYI5_9FUSO|nr:5'-methylthioadenosine/adenosylhomocysteine nucleosidase [Fusobacterium necrophorum]RXZ68681.1 5'-methylthioadenosine/adenosylhomocysteine nucleosidase [Fusobacterium necrophorum]
MRIGIMGAMHEEITELKQDLEPDYHMEKMGDLEFMIGKLYGREVVLVEAGIGKVNAALCATLLSQHFQVNALLFTGVAGALYPEIEIADIVLGTELVEHDFDVTAFGYPLGKIPRMDVHAFPADPRILKVAEKVGNQIFGESHIFQGRILSGDQFVADLEKIRFLRETFDGYCTEMEGAAVAHVCHILGTPFLIIRSISDKANHEAQMDYPEFVKIAAKNSKKMIEGILQESIWEETL